MKPTTLLGTLPGLDALGRRCKGNHWHEHLQGTVAIPLKEGGHKTSWRTSLAGRYNPNLCRAWAQIARQAAPRGGLCIHGPSVDPSSAKLSWRVTSANPPAPAGQNRSYRAAAPASGPVPSRSGAGAGAAGALPASSPGQRGNRRAAQREERAVARLARAGSNSFDGRFLKRRSVTQVTFERYSHWSEALEHFAKRRRLELTNEDLADQAIEKMMDELFFAGENPYTGRAVLYGYAFMHDIPTCGARSFTRAKRLLKGWTREAPEYLREPATWSAVLLIVRRLAESFGHIGLEAARCTVLAFDLFGRPSGMINLTYHALVLPAPDVSSSFNKYAVVFAPPGLERSVAAAPPRAKPGEYDATAMACDRASLAAGQSVVRPFLDFLRRRGGRSRSRVFSALTLARWEGLMKEAAKLEGLGPLSYTPHSLRHGGASHDMAQGLRDAASTQARGRWLARQSVVRYGKFGMYQRQLAKLSVKQRQDGTAISRRLQSILQV